MAPGPITLWQIDGETIQTVTDIIFLGSKITADGDCSHEIKRHLLLGIKAMTNLDSILKSREITLPTKVHLTKPMVFPVVMYGCENWTIKKDKNQRLMLLYWGRHWGDTSYRVRVSNIRFADLFLEKQEKAMCLYIHSSVSLHTSESTLFMSLLLKWGNDY